MTTTVTDGTDLDMLAYDLADMLDRFGYADIDASQPEIREALPAFLAGLREIAARRDEQEPGVDAASWSPVADRPEPPVIQAPKYGRVRVYPVYVFSATDPSEPERDEIWVTDYDKQGEVWARRQAETTAGEADGAVGRLLRKEKFRWLPYAGTPRTARP